MEIINFKKSIDLGGLVENHGACEAQRFRRPGAVDSRSASNTATNTFVLFPANFAATGSRHCEHYRLARAALGRRAVSPRPDCRRPLPQRRCELHRGGPLRDAEPRPASRMFDEAALDECACRVAAFT